MFTVKDILRDLVREEIKDGNTTIKYMECSKCNIPFVTECNENECVVCSGKIKERYPIVLGLCPMCGIEMNCHSMTACSQKCRNEANKLGIGRKERREMIEKGIIITTTTKKPKKYKGWNEGVNKGSHPWKSRQKGTYGKEM